MTTCIIVAAAENHVIGNQGQMPWHLPADLRNFKDLTMDFPIVMGRKTFDSIGKALPGRINVVITHQRGLDLPGAAVVHSLKEALEAVTNYPQVFIIGGSQIYREALEQDLVDLVYLTRVHESYDGDAYFPPLPAARWERVSERRQSPDAHNAVAFSFETYIRKRA